MKLASEAAALILKNALVREQETRDYYRTCLDKASVDGTKIILKSLIRDEERHVDIVSAMLKEAEKNGSAGSIESGSTDTASDVYARAFPHGIAAEGDFKADSASVGEMLKKALDNEQESYDNYDQAAKESEEDDARALFEKLAVEEKNHYILIANLIQYLDDPGTWIYSEANELFSL